MKQFAFIITLIASITLSVFGGNAEAKTCEIYPGSGGEDTFTGWPMKKIAILEVSKSVTLWLNDACVEPKVFVAKGNNVKYTMQWEKVCAGYDKCDESSRTNVAQGWRIFMWTTDAKDAGKEIRVTIRSGVETFRVEVKIHEHVLGLARGAAKDASDAKRKADEAKSTAEDAKVTSEDAEALAKEAQKNTGGTGGKRDFELMFSPMFSLESPGHEGYGMALGGSAILGKFGKRGMAQFGVSARLSWHYFEQEVIGLAQNSDVMASEFDFLAQFMFRLRPIWWFALDLETGFGARIFTHDDAVTLQNQELMIQGVEGRVASHPIWAANVGIKFYPHKKIFLGLQYGVTVPLTRQVQNPNAEGGPPSKANCWNQFLLFNVGFSL